MRFFVRGATDAAMMILLYALGATWLWVGFMSGLLIGVFLYENWGRC